MLSVNEQTHNQESPRKHGLHIHHISDGSFRSLRKLKLDLHHTSSTPATTHPKNNQKFLRPDFTEREYQNRNAYGLPKIKTANKSIMSYIQASRNATRQQINTEDDSRGTDSSLSFHGPVESIAKLKTEISKRAGFEGFSPLKALLNNNKDIDILAHRPEKSQNSQGYESQFASRLSLDDFTGQSFDFLPKAPLNQRYRRKSCECTWCGGISIFEKTVHNHPAIPPILPNERNCPKKEEEVPCEKPVSRANLSKTKFETSAKQKMKSVSKNIISLKNAFSYHKEGTQGSLTPKPFLQKLNTFGNKSRRSSIMKSLDLDQKEMNESRQSSARGTNGRDQNSLLNVQETTVIDNKNTSWEKGIFFPSKKDKNENELALSILKMTSRKTIKKNLTKLRIIKPSPRQTVENSPLNEKTVKEKESKDTKIARSKLKRITVKNPLTSTSSQIRRTYGLGTVQTPHDQYKLTMSSQFYRIVNKQQRSLPIYQLDSHRFSQSSINNLSSRDQGSVDKSLRKTEESKKPTNPRVLVKPLKDLDRIMSPYGLLEKSLESRSGRLKTMESPKTVKSNRNEWIMRNYSLASGNKRKIK